MPRRQRFKPSRKPKPAIEPSENEIIPQSKPTVDRESHAQSVGQRADVPREERHPDDVEDRASR